jgi:ribosomal protein S18 acetylase RimI-like enzyme
MRFFRSVHKVMPAHPAEAAALARLYSRTYAACRPDLDRRLLGDLTPPPEEVVAWFGGGFELYRTLHDDELVGAVRLSFPSGACHLDRLAVDPNVRRQGHGRALVEHAIGRARRGGATRIWAQVSPKLEAAVELFHHTGFRESARYQAFYWGEPVLLLELLV